MNTTPWSRLFGPARPFHLFGQGLFMLLSALLLALPVPALAAPGDLDPSFDGDGRVLTDFGAFEGAGAVVVQPDGKVVAAGSSSSFANGNHEIDFALARYNRDGSLDKSFGLEGRVVTDFVGGMDIARALVLQPDGKLVAAGSRFFSTGNGNVRTDITLERFNPDGSLDTSFGTGGLVVTDFGEDSAANALVLQADGKLVVAGTLGAFRAFALTRYHSDGSRDMSFGTGGLVRTDFGRTSSGAGALRPTASWWRPVDPMPAATRISPWCAM